MSENVPKVRADARERAERAWNARLAGFTWRQAAEIADYSTPQNAIRAVRQVYGQVPEIDRDELRHLWRERVEVLWRQSIKDVHQGRQGAMIAATKLAGLAVMIDGLAQPQRVDIGFMGVIADLDALMKAEGL